MARVELMKGIVAIHGRLGNMIYRSRKQPDGTYKVYVHEAPKTKRSIGLVSDQHRTNIGPTSRDKRNLKNQSNEKRKQSPS